MAFKRVDGPNKTKKSSVVGVIKKLGNNFYLELNSKFQMALFVPKDGKYYKVNQLPVQVVEEGDTLFEVQVDLEDTKQVDYIGS